MTATPWLPTARALAAVWDGPPLAQFVVSDCGPQHWCDDCGALCLGAGCVECDTVPADNPDADTVPDLDSLANVGALLDALPLGWVVGKPASGGYRASDGNQRFSADTAAHALALAYVAVR